MKLKARNVNITSISLSSSNIRRPLLLVADSITVVYTVLIPRTVYPLSYYINALTTAVQSGSFSTVLQANALQYNAASLLHATSSSIGIGMHLTYTCHKLTAETMYVK